MKFSFLIARIQILSILFISCINQVFSQSDFEKKFGTGMLVVTYDTNFVLNLYSQPNEANLTFNIVIGLDSAAETKSLTAFVTPDQKSWFHPETFWDEEKIMHFVVLETKNNWHKIIVDKTTQKSMWVLRSPNFKYFKWKDYLPNSTGIERIKPKENPIYKSIFPIKTLLNFDGQNCFKILKIKGDWVKVQYNYDMCPVVYQYKVLPKGWFRWRDEKGLLINYFLR